MNTETRSRKNFLEFLQHKDFLTKDQMLELDQEMHRMPDIKVRDALLKKYITSEENIYSAWAEYLSLPYIDLNSTIFDPEALALVPSDFARQNALIPFGIYPGELSVAFDYLDVNVIDSLRRQTRCDILPHIAIKSQILKTIEVQYGAIDIEKATEEIDLNEYDNKSIQSLEAVQTGPVVNISKGIVINALKYRASDIHIEPREDYLQIRYRIDGLLQEKYKLESKMSPLLISRYKIMAELDIAERRIPQDGRIQYIIGERRIDIRVSVVPTIKSEKVVLRILDKSDMSLDIKKMFFSNQIEEQIQRIANSSHGMFFVTGPTGSGKTTTLYSVINHINSIEKNIVTIEDPVEYRLPFLNQIQVNYDIGLDFPKVLRSVLRQDPDIILIGEIRDLETARIATEAALTGHLVLASLHTNNAVDAIMRLVEIGVDSFMVAPTLLGILSQRLVRRICLKCKESYIADPEEAKHFGVEAEGTEIELFRGKGCPACAGTGYSGRLAIHELVIVNDEIRNLISEEADGNKIARAAHEIGYRTMRFDGLKKALRGLTSLDEVLRVTTERKDFFLE
ncbi:type II secretion system protein GspE [Candidatus Poribacteria bacterium]|nr:type II secretion system protein GspE [Candidatus Poribacteria bacterium]